MRFVRATEFYLKPVTPNPSAEATELLRFIAGISGSNILAGQHNVPLVGSTRLAGAYKVTGHYPALFGQDFGFAPTGDWDGINFRQRTIDDAIARAREGYLI